MPVWAERRQLVERLLQDPFKRYGAQYLNDPLAGATIPIGIYRTFKPLLVKRVIELSDGAKYRISLRRTVDHAVSLDPPPLTIANIDCSDSEARRFDQTA